MKLLRRYLPFVLAVVLLGVVVFLALDLKRSGERRAVGQFNAYQVLVAQEVADRTRERLETSAEVLLHLAYLASQRAGDATGLHPLVDAFSVPAPGLPAMSIVAVDEVGGVIVAGRSDLPDVKPLEPGLLEWARREENKGKVQVFLRPTADHRDAAGSRPASHLLVATPFWHSATAATPQRWAGLLLASVEMVSILELQPSMTGPESRPLGFWILDHDGTVLLQTDHPEMVSRNIRRHDPSCLRCHTSFDYVERMLVAGHGTAEYQLHGQPAKLSAFAPMVYANASWTVVVNAPQAEVVGFLQRSVQEMSVLLGLLVVAFSLGSWSLYRSSRLRLSAQDEARRWQDKHEFEERLRQTRERAEAEVGRLLHQHTLILDSVMDGIVGLDAEGRQTFINAAAARMLGWTAEELVGLPSHTMWHHTRADGQPYDPARCPIYAAYKDGKLHHGSDEVFWRQDGTSFAVEFSSAPIREQGRLVGAVVTFHDLTERRRLEAQLRQAQKMEAIGTLAGGIAHDFNNILGAIIGNTELAMSEIAAEGTARECLTDVMKATERAADLVRQILSFSRNREQERHSLNMAPIVKESLKLIRATLPATIAIDAEVADDLPFVKADPTQLYQVLMNLAANSAHAMRESGGRLSVQIASAVVDASMASEHPHLHEGAYVRLTVGDTGHGMDAATLERVFEPFFTTKAPGEGTGLGLAVVHGIVRGLDGATFVRSEPGLGTTFDIYIPVDDSRPAQSAPQSTEVPAGDGQRILFIDDEPALGRIARRVLENLHYQVETYTSPSAAMDAYEAKPAAFELVITDLAMPGMSGLELVRRVRQTRPDQRIILMTGFSGTLSADKIRQLALPPVIHKPIDAATLGRAVHAALHGEHGPGGARG